MTHAVVTFGCRVNQADSFAVEDALRARGSEAAAPEQADVVVVNTCAVTASAEQAARQTIRRIGRVNPGARLVVTGCYATRCPGELAELPGVLRVVRNPDKDDLVASVADEVGLGSAERFGNGDGPCGSTLEPGVAGRTALTLRVQTGCDEHCSYCIIPSTRGPGRSRATAAVLGDVDRAVAAGYKEIAITGVHLGSYGRDLRDGSSLASLLRALAEVDDDVLFRISSLEPMDCTPDVVDLVASSSRFAPHFHLPLQHGSDAMLLAMRRPYTVVYYRALIERTRALMPHACIGSDVIVGFPGETASHVEEMRAALEQLPLSYLHVFPYSDRPGTEASRLRPKVDGRAIRERAAQVRAIGARKAIEFRQSQVGRIMCGLTVDDGSSVVTPNYLKLRIPAGRARNEWVRVQVRTDMSADVLP